MAASMPSCLRDANSTCSPNVVNERQEAQSGEWSIAKNSEREKPQRDTQKISLATTMSSINEKRTCNTTALEQPTLKLDSRFGFLSAQQAATDNLLEQNEESKVTFASSSTTNFAENSTERKNVTKESAIPGSAVTIEECVYISKVELGPLYSRGSSISHSPSTIQPEAEGELIVRMPETIKLPTSFPKYSNIPGMPCLHQPKVIAWPDDRGILIQKLQSNRFPLLLYSGYSSYLYGSNADITKMMHLTLSCSRSASTSGFPSYVKCEPNMVHLLPTCTRICRIPGLASVEFVSGCEKEGFWDRSPISPVQIKETFIFPMSWTQEQAVSDSNMLKTMVAMLPTCSKKASLPGFPSAPQQLASYTPNNASFLPTCPGQTMIAGMPFRKKHMAYHVSWHILRGFIFDRPLRRRSFLVQGKSCVDKEHVKLIVSMLTSCPWKALIPCFPSVSFKEYTVPSVSFAPSQDPSMVDLLPTFPRKSRVNGLPSKELVSYQSADLDINHILIERPLRIHNALIQDNFPLTSEAQDKKEMVAMLSSCPVRTCLVGMPTRTQKLLPNIIYLVPMCPKLARTPGMPSQDQNTSHNRDWHALKQLLLMTPQKRTQAYIGQWILEDTENLKNMVNMGCLASASRQKPCMINLIPSLPRHSGISGLPSKTGQKGCLSSCTEWFAYKNILWEPTFFKREVQILNEVLFFDKNNSQSMTALLSSCPENVSVPGFPSALTLTNGPTIVKSSHLFPSLPCQMSADIPSMNNLLFTCPDQSRVCGMPSIFHRESYGADWIINPIWRRPLKNPGRMSVIQDHKMNSREKTLVRIMVSMLPPCPKHSSITGIPSKVGKRRVKVLLKEVPSMLKSLETFPKHSKIPGLPAKNSTKGGWYFHSNVVWEKTFNTVQQNLKALELSFADRNIMLSMQLSCPRQALNPGFPSAPQLQASDAIVDKYLDMVQLLPCCPRQSNIIGIPSRMPFISPSNVEGRSVVIIDIQGCCTCWKMSDYCYKDRIKAILSLETVEPNNTLSPGFKDVPLPDFIHFQNMANIVPSCPKQGSVLGVPSTTVHHSGHRWPGKTLLLVESQAELTEKEKENQMRQRLSPEELSLHNVPVYERFMEFINPSQDVPDDVQQRMTIESTCLLQTTVQDLPLSNYETQVDQPSSVSGTEMLYDDARPNIIEPDTIKPQSDPWSLLEANKNEQANRLSIDAEEKTVIGKG